MRATSFSAFLIVPLLLLPGCGSDEEDDAMAAICSARDGIATQVDDLRSLTLTTGTTSQVADAVDSIGSDLTTIEENREKLSDDRRDAVEKANDAFADQVRDLAGTIGRTVSVEGAASQLESAFQQLATSYRNTFGQLDCS